MRDRRDYVIAALAAALVFSLGLQVGSGFRLLPSARADDPAGGAAGNPSTPPGEHTTGAGAAGNSGGVTINPGPPSFRPGIESRTTPHTASDSNSNNRFVAVTTPVGSGESVTFLIDSETEQLLVYRFLRDKGVQLVAGRKIDFDLRLSAYNDLSKYTRDEMKALFDKQQAVANNGNGKGG